mgnify:CR=1 FL=1
MSRSLKPALASIALATFLASCASVPPVEVERKIAVSDKAMSEIPPLYDGETKLDTGKIVKAWAHDRRVASICVDRHAALRSVILRRPHELVTD